MVRSDLSPRARAYSSASFFAMLPFWPTVFLISFFNLVLFLISISFRIYQRLHIEHQVEALLKDPTAWIG
jgi:hypothetical protein